MEDDKYPKPSEELAEDEQLLMRRDFLRSLRKWSTAVIGGVVLGKLLRQPETAAGWVNRRGSWVNGGGGGASWANRGAAWANRGASWLNGGGGGGGGGSWVNRRG